MNVAIYTRISQDDGTALGVTRQEADCRAYCDQRGWDVARVFTENDVSAYGKKKRPLYAELLEGIEAHTYEGLVVWHPDRLHRHPAELEHFIDLVERTRITVASVTAGDYDLSTPEGRLTARIVGSVARKESEDKSRRLRRKHLELADAGKVSGGGRRPFGYEIDRMTIRENEADEIRMAAARVLAGESVRGIVRDWQARGVATVTGAEWQSTTVQRLLKSGRISGQREHHGRIVGPGTWPAIIDADDTMRLRAVLNDPTRRKNATTVRSYLLTGMMVCGRCDSKMSTRPTAKGVRRYVCTVDRGGCGRCGIAAEPVEALISETVLQFLDTPELARAVAKRNRRSGSGRAPDGVAVLEARMLELAQAFAAGEVSRAEWVTARDAIDARLTDAKRLASADVGEEAAASYVGQGGVLREQWDDLSLDQRRAVVAAVLETVVIAPTTKAGNKFNPDRVTVIWRQ